MPVRDDQAATLLALLKGDFEEYERLHEQLDPDLARTGYTALIAAAFFTATNRRFTSGSSPAEVIEFVGDVRSRSDGAATQLDPKAAETLLRAAAFGDDADARIDDKTVIQTQFLLLAALIADEQLDNSAIDSFVTDARALADEWLS